MTEYIFLCKYKSFKSAKQGLKPQNFLLAYYYFGSNIKMFNFNLIMIKDISD